MDMIEQLFEEELIVRLGKALEKNNATKKQISSIISTHERHKAEKLLYSSMIADISEKLFGPNATKAPRFLANVHCGWACGPGGLKEGECYVEAYYRTKNEVKNNDWIDEWKNFLTSMEQNKT